MALTNSVKYNKNLLRMYATTKTEKRERKRERERERGGTRSPGRHFSKSFPTKNERPTRGKFHFIFSIYFSNTRPFLLPSFSPPLASKKNRLDKLHSIWPKNRRIDRWKKYKEKNRRLMMHWVTRWRDSKSC